MLAGAARREVHSGRTLLRRDREQRKLWMNSDETEEAVRGSCNCWLPRVTSPTRNTFGGQNGAVSSGANPSESQSMVRAADHCRRRIHQRFAAAERPASCRVLLMALAPVPVTQFDPLIPRRCVEHLDKGLVAPRIARNRPISKATRPTLSTGWNTEIVWNSRGGSTPATRP